MTDKIQPQVPPMSHTPYFESAEMMASMQLRKRAMEASHHGVFIVDVTDPDKPIVSVNQSFSHLTGYRREQVIGQPFTILMGDVQQEDDIQRALMAITENTEQKLELQCYHSSGELFWAEMDLAPIPNSEGQTTHIIGILHDITMRRGMEEQLIQQATHDALTKLPNRTLLIERFQQAQMIARKRNELMGLLFVDLDRFKYINDTYGHNVGDQVLYLVAQRLINHTRDDDTVARIGGDEFIILLPSLRSIRDGELIAESILHSISQPYGIDNKKFILTASVGISFFPRDGDDFDLLLKQADAAMYRAKEDGRNTLRTFTNEHSERILHRVRIEKECREAVKNKEFRLQYQPIFHMPTGKVFAIEALLRWPRYSHGELVTRDLIHIAEEAHLIMDIGEWVLTTACQQMKSLYDLGFADIKLSVNISKVQLRYPGFLDSLLKILKTTQFDPRCLFLEIQESCLIEAVETTHSTLTQMRAMGISICIDDFGTGYSSLSCLKQLPVDQLKVDSSFIHDMVEGKSDAAVTQAIINLGNVLHLGVMAEGVETDAQRLFLLENHCEYAQGYLFSGPLDWEQLQERYFNLDSNPPAL